MAPPRLTIGTFGEIATRMMPSGHFEARTRYRDWDGQVRLVQATADTAMAAERALKVKIAKRRRVRPGESSLTPDSLFSDLVNYWLEDIDLEERISRTTRNLYERNMRTLVLPAFGHLTLREIGVARCDRFIKEMAKRSCNSAKQARVVLRLAIELACDTKCSVDHCERPSSVAARSRASWHHTSARAPVPPCGCDGGQWDVARRQRSLTPFTPSESDCTMTVKTAPAGRNVCASQQGPNRA